MASKHREGDSRPAKKARRVSQQFPRQTLPDVSATEAHRHLRKTATLNFRLTEVEKESVRRAAASVKMPISEYLLKCHDAVSRKLGLH